ncbi:MAG: hypothetical protein ABIP90_11840 [Vicinamibacterales bacterium]
MAMMVLAAGCSQSPTAPRNLVLPLPAGKTANPPVIISITGPTTRREAGTDIALSAVVEDVDTPLSQLTFAWTANVGTIVGNGASAVFRLAPGIQKGVDVVVTLTVIEAFTGKRNGQPIAQEFRVSRQAAPFRVHDSVAELKELARRFLIDLFGNSAISPVDALVDFSENGPCKQGRAEELQDLINHRRDYVVLERSLNGQSVFFTSPDTAIIDNDAFFRDLRRSDLFIGTTRGNFPLTAVYESGRWWLCTSGFDDDLKGDGGLATIKRNRGRTIIKK